MSVTPHSGLATPPSAERRGGPRLLPRSDRLLVSRFSYGITPDLAKRVRTQGGAEAWFEDQLRPGRIKDRKADKLDRWYPSLGRRPADLWRRQITEVEGGWEVMDDYARWCLLRRVESRRQVHEVMTEFWENHLHVPVVGDEQFTHRVRYGEVIRRHALGRFHQMLVDAVTHPAMLIYLDAAESTKEHPNENLGRELLELHTVGVGNHNERDVKSSARILTGWPVDYWESWAPVYRTEDHFVGRVEVKGFRDKNGSADGQKVTKAYLRYLARHPRTAEHIATKLATKFIGDRPSRALVARPADIYLRNDTAIKAGAPCLVASSAFRKSADMKVRDPGEDVVATYRALGVKIRKPAQGDAGGGSAATQIIYQPRSIGAAPHGWASPDGAPIDNASGSSPSRLLASMREHQNLAGGWWPNTAV